MLGIDMVTRPVLLIWLTLHSMGARGFFPQASVRRTCVFSSFSSSALLQSSVPSPSSPSTTTSVNTTTTTLITRSEIRALFHLLADESILYDPSRGTCCRSRCSGCTYIDPWSGNFIFDEYNIASTLDNGSRRDDDGEYVGGWIAPYVTIDFGERAHTSAWGRALFLKMMEGEKPPRKEVERQRFESLLGVATTAVGSSSLNVVSSLALQSLWNILSPSVGYPKLSKVDITQAIKGMEGSDYAMGGAVNFATFEKSIIIAAERIVNGHYLDDTNGIANPPGSTMDYDSMTKEELLEECATRGMRSTFPKMKRIIIEELRFFDANGRQGKRHPVKNTLS